ncbi:MAG: iron chelate uptake ABC transporter family permease subunit [Burkholderiales bacterium]|nr:iron chelate uptake ABC transporter family permease subunit [Burkholderiales bacterium]
MTLHEQPLLRVALIAAALLAAAMVLSLVVGAYPLPFSKLLSGELNDAEWSVLTQLRAPRVLAACAGGAAFALAGAALQALFRNPLADPGLLGVPSAAGLGAAIALIVMGAGAALWLGALAGAALALAAMLFVVRRGAGPMAGGTVTLLLLGIAINAACAAGLALLTALASEGQLKTLSFWMLGSFAALDWPVVVAMLACTATGAVALLAHANALAALALGERAARTVGVDVQQLRFRVAVVTAAMVAIITAFCGGVGFVGLAAPHIARLTVGSSPRRTLPVAALIGAMLCVLADVVARSIAPPIELPVGAITAVLGVPLLVSLVTRKSQQP